MMGVPVYDPNELSKEELIEVLGLGEDDRIVNVDGKVIIFNIDQIEFKAENLFKDPPPSSAYLDSYPNASAATGPVTRAELSKWAEIFRNPDPPRFTDPIC